MEFCSCVWFSLTFLHIISVHRWCPRPRVCLSVFKLVCIQWQGTKRIHKYIKFERERARKRGIEKERNRWKSHNEFSDFNDHRYISCILLRLMNYMTLLLWGHFDFVGYFLQFSISLTRLAIYVCSACKSVLSISVVYFIFFCRSLSLKCDVIFLETIFHSHTKHTHTNWMNVKTEHRFDWIHRRKKNGGANNIDEYFGVSDVCRTTETNENKKRVN